MFLDFSVYLTIENNTGEALVRHDVGTDHGKWTDVPDEIRPGASPTCRLKNSIGLTGTDGWFSFQFCSRRGDRNEHLLPNTYLSGRLGCVQSIRKKLNKVDIDCIAPAALYIASFYASSGEDWTKGKVDAGGNPVKVVSSVDYQDIERYRFQIERISAFSDHPVRNSRDTQTSRTDEPHELWNQSSADGWIDGRTGSLRPNAFAYEFGSKLSDLSALTMSITVLDCELIGESDDFLISTLSSIAVNIHITEPNTSTKPFALNGDVEWEMTLRLSGQKVECIRPEKTRLELYWIAQRLHPAFKRGGIPVEFLRVVLPSTPSSDFSDWKIEMTRRAFEDYNKSYDTVTGHAAFGVDIDGGAFHLADYFLPDASGRPGTRCSLGLRANDPPMHWVAQNPFGYIKDTHLVGVVDRDGNLLTVNNPYFGTDQTRSHLRPQDPTRKPFGCHTYQAVGYGQPSHALDRHIVYDACSGPYLGTESISEYLTRSMDTQQRPGRPIMKPGVTCVNQWHRMFSLDHTDSSSEVLTILGLPEAGTTISSITYVNWAHLPEWIKDVLGDDWDTIAKTGYVGVTETTASACWRLERQTSTETSISIDVHVASEIDADGVLDMAASKQAALRKLARIITSTSRDIKDVWTRGELDEFGEYSVQDLDGGRFVLVAGQTVLDIRDRGPMYLTAEAFEGYARKLLEHTVRRDSPPLAAPVIKRGPLLSLTDKHDESHPKKIQIRSVIPRFSLWFELGRPIAVADAIVEGAEDAISIESRVVEGDVRVKFTFAVAMPGHHLVEVHANFADSETMVSTSQMFEVEVIYTRRQTH